MTELNPGKSVTRLTHALVRDGGPQRRVVVTLHADFIELRLHGTRRKETLSLDGLYQSAVKGRVFKEKMDKAKERKARKEASKPRRARR